MTLPLMQKTSRRNGHQRPKKVILTVHNHLSCSSLLGNRSNGTEESDINEHGSSKKSSKGVSKSKKTASPKPPSPNLMSFDDGTSTENQPTKSSATAKQPSEKSKKKQLDDDAWDMLNQ